MNFWNIKLYGARVGDDFDTKITKFNVSNGYSL